MTVGEYAVVPQDEGLRAALRSVRLVVFDFDGVFTDNAVWVFEDGREAVRCSRSDGIGLQRLRSAGVEAFILSTETNPVVTARAKKLKLVCRQGCDDKLSALHELARERDLPLDAIAFVGNDVNDASCLEAVGLPIVVADAHPDVLALARLRSTRTGGHGAVREICDLIVKARLDG